jgi:hypothetical protein
MLGGHYKNFDAIAMTYYLRFTNESAWTLAATAAGFIENDTLAAYTHDHAIDVVGTITRGGTYDPETGEVIVAPTVLDGFHINFIGTLPDGWDEFLVSPVVPYRVFAA